MNAELLLDLEADAGYDPRTILEAYASSSEQVGATRWRVAVASPLHGLAIANASTAEEILTISSTHPIDADGWADWTKAGADEWEMSSALLPAKRPGTPVKAVYRYDDAWVWDPTAPAADPAALADLGLEELSSAGAEAAQGRGGWIWKGVKISWKVAGRLGDPRVQAAIWLTRQGWKVLQEQSVAQRARMDKQEFERRLLINLNETRRQRLETGSGSSRRKARQYYSTLDALIAMNS